MIRAIANGIMFRRARRLAERLLPLLPESGMIADVGSGTGHNAMILNSRAGDRIVQYDVADLHWVGKKPEIVDAQDVGSAVSNRQFAGVLLIYVLQYPDDEEQLLRQIFDARISSVLVVQSTCNTRWGRTVFWIQERVFGSVAFFFARFARLIPKQNCPVHPLRLFRSDDVVILLNRCGFEIVARDEERNRFTGIGSDICVCRRSES